MTTSTRCDECGKDIPTPKISSTDNETGVVTDFCSGTCFAAYVKKEG